MIQNLQVLRAIAALLVVAFHAVGTAGGYGRAPEALLYVKHLGQAGVDLFFVISGFVIVYIQNRNPRSARTFFIRRLVRIVPLYWALLAFVLVLFALVPSLFGDRLSVDQGHAIASFAFSSMAVFGENPLIYLGWTLEWELMFYCLFALGLALQVSPVIFAAVVLVGMALVNPTNTVGLEFVLGMMSALMFRHGWGRSFAAPALLFGVMLWSCSLLWLPAPEMRVLVWGVPAMLILLGALYLPQISSRTLNVLGNASYSIYLIQFLTLPAVYKALAVTRLEIETYSAFGLAVIATALSGVFLHRLFERPANTWLNQRLSKPKTALQSPQSGLVQLRTNS